MAKLGISIKLKENVCIFRSGLSWVKYKQHEGQCFPNLSSGKEPLKQFFIFTGNPNYGKDYRQGNVDGVGRNSSIATFLSKKFIGNEFLHAYKIILQKIEECSCFLCYLIFLTSNYHITENYSSIANYRAKISAGFRGMFRIFTVQ